MNKRYTVYETNADLEPLHSHYSGESQDIAETTMLKLFPQNTATKDFMITSTVGGEVHLHALMLSDRSKRLRGECQG